MFGNNSKSWATYVEDASVTELMVNGPESAWVQRAGAGLEPFPRRISRPGCTTAPPSRSRGPRSMVDPV